MACRIADLIAPTLEGRPLWTWSELRSWTSLAPKSILAPSFQHGKKWPHRPLGAPSQHALKGVFSEAAYRAFSRVARRRVSPDLSRPAHYVVARGDPSVVLGLVSQCLSTMQAGPYQVQLGLYLARVAAQHGIEYLRGKPPALQVSTLHAAKGGQADVVWLSDNFGRRFSRNRSTLAGLESARNMLYVGMTRARHELAVLNQGRHSVGLARFVTP